MIKKYICIIPFESETNPIYPGEIFEMNCVVAQIQDEVARTVAVLKNPDPEEYGPGPIVVPLDALKFCFEELVEEVK